MTAELIMRCHNAPDSDMLCRTPDGAKRVIQMSDQVVINFGPDVTHNEARNQARVYEMANPDLIRIPKVHGFFTDPQAWVCLVMDFMDGRVIDPLEDEAKVAEIATVLAYFATLHGDVPGPLGGGASCGLLFVDAGEPTFTDIADIERWCNDRLFTQEGKLDLKGCELVLCHLDFAPRNFLWSDDKPLCLLDWSSGVLPKDIQVLRSNNHGGKGRQF